MKIAMLIKGTAFLALAASLAVPAARLLWHGLGYDTVASRDLPPVALSQEVAAPDTGAVLALAPFGNATPMTAPEAVPETGLGLVLQGVILSGDPARSSAFILAAGQGDRFQIGDKITDNITLTAIRQTHVELDVGGQPRILGFPNATPPEQVAEEGADGKAELDPLARLRAAAVDGIARERVPKSPPQTIQGYVDLWRSRIRANPQQVLDAIGLVAGDRGYIIAPEHDIGLTRVGLRAGDLVTRVNGEEVGDVDRDRTLYDQIAASGLAQVEIERDGEVMTMSFPLR